MSRDNLNLYIFVYRLLLIAALNYFAGLYQSRALPDGYWLPINLTLAGWQRTITPRVRTYEELVHALTLSQPIIVYWVFKEMQHLSLSQLTQEIL